MKKIKLIFQGDSITDAGRDKRNYYHMGNGYPKYAAELMTEQNKAVEFEFINMGISGNRTSQLFDRLYWDTITFEPDVVSILIGINDVWHRHGWSRILTSDEQIELNYRSILERLKKETNAKIVILQPYVIDGEGREAVREDLKKLHPIVKRLADEFADVYIPLDELLAEAMKTQSDPQYYSADGFHPNENGAEFIGQKYAQAVQPLIESL